MTEQEAFDRMALMRKLFDLFKESPPVFDEDKIKAEWEKYDANRRAVNELLGLTKARGRPAAPSGPTAEGPDRKALAEQMQRERAELSDKLNGTPCAEIRWQQERDALRADLARMKAALEWYANPEIYKPHPHGPAFDRRDLSFHARDALKGT